MTRTVLQVEYLHTGYTIEVREDGKPEVKEIEPKKECVLLTNKRGQDVTDLGTYQDKDFLKRKIQNTLPKYSKASDFKYSVIKYEMPESEFVRLCQKGHGRKKVIHEEEF